jgi:hypothetical protein
LQDKTESYYAIRSIRRDNVHEMVGIFDWFFQNKEVEDGQGLLFFFWFAFFGEDFCGFY